MVRGPLGSAFSILAGKTQMKNTGGQTLWCRLQSLQYAWRDLNAAGCGGFEGKVSTALKMVANSSQSRFNSKTYVFVSSTLFESPWCLLSKCVWNGPSVLIAKKILRDVYKASPEVSRLLVDLLKISDATYKDLLNELIASARPLFGACRRKDIPLFYQSLSRMTSAANESEVLYVSTLSVCCVRANLT
jgi:hypothetical protein